MRCRVSLACSCHLYLPPRSICPIGRRLCATMTIISELTLLSINNTQCVLYTHDVVPGIMADSYIQRALTSYVCEM